MTTTAGVVVTVAEIETVGGRVIEALTGPGLPIDAHRGAEMETGIIVASGMTRMISHEIVATVLLTLGPAAEVMVAAGVVKLLRMARASEKMRFYPLLPQLEFRPLLIPRHGRLSQHKPRLKRTSRRRLNDFENSKHGKRSTQSRRPWSRTPPLVPRESSSPKWTRRRSVRPWPHRRPPALPPRHPI
jgi:hypothetical protein